MDWIMIIPYPRADIFNPVADDMDKTVVKNIFFFKFFDMIQSDAPTNYHFGQSNLSEFLIFGIFF